MNLVPRKKNQHAWRPFHELERIQDELSQLFDFPLSSTSLGEMGDWSPALDVHENKDEVIVRADVPGLDKNQIHVRVNNGILTIEGERKEETEKKEEGFVRKERYVGSFKRMLNLGSDVDSTNAKAKYKNGVLELHLPKKEEAKTKDISIDIE